MYHSEILGDNRNSSVRSACTPWPDTEILFMAVLSSLQDMIECDWFTLLLGHVKVRNSSSILRGTMDKNEAIISTTSKSRSLVTAR